MSAPCHMDCIYHLHRSLLSKTIIKYVVFLGQIYQEGNEMNQYKLQNKRAASDRAYKKANKKLRTLLTPTINTSIRASSSRNYLSPSRGRNNRLYSSLWETMVRIHPTQAMVRPKKLLI